MHAEHVTFFPQFPRGSHTALALFLFLNPLSYLSLSRIRNLNQPPYLGRCALSSTITSNTTIVIVNVFYAFICTPAHHHQQGPHPMRSKAQDGRGSSTNRACGAWSNVIGVFRFQCWDFYLF